MKRKLLSVLLTLAMALALLSVSAMAAGETAEAPTGEGETPAVEYVAKVGNQGYKTLAEALQDWAASGGTLQLLQDGKLTTKVTLKKECTLDLNGKTLSTDVSQALYVNGGTLTIEDSGKNGVYESTNSGQIYINSGSVTLNTGTVKGAGGVSGVSYGVVNVCRYNSSFTMNGGAVECTGTMTKGGLDSTKGYAIVGTGIKKDNPNLITINGGTVKSVGDAIYTKENSVHYTIGGNAQVGRITIVATSSGYPTHLTFTGNALIDGLTVTGKYLGSFTAENTVRFKSNISDVLADTSYGCLPAEDSTYKVDRRTEENAAAAVINDKGTTYYGTLSGAAKNVGAGETVKLLQDCTSAYQVKVNNAAYGMTLDLNGHNITNTNTKSTANALELSFVGQDSYVPVKITNSSDTVATISAATPVKAHASRGAMAVVIGENVTLNSTVDQRQMKLEGSAYVDVSGKTDAEVDALGDLWKTADNKLFGDLSYAAKFSTGDVTLVKDYTGSSGLTARNTCVVDFNGHTYNYQSKKTYVLVINNGVSVTLKNGMLTSGTDHTGIITNGTNSNISLTLQDFNLSVPNGRGIYFPSSGTVVIEDSVINAKHFGVQVCAGSLTVSGDKTTITATGDPQTKIENDGPIDDGAAVSIVNRTGYKELGKVQILGGAFAASDTSKAVKAYSFNNTDKKEDAWDNVTDNVSISGGYFTSDPTAYLAADHYVWASDKDGYAYMVKDAAPTSADQKIIVIDKTEATVNGSISTDDKSKIEAVRDKTNVDGVAEAVAAKKADLIPENVDTSAATKIEVEVSVKVEVTGADLTSENKTLTFEAKPVATVKVNGTATGTTVPVENSMLNGNPITVKLPLPAGFTPNQILHKSAGYADEYILQEGNAQGLRSFEIVEEDGVKIAVFTVSHFSTFELSGEVTYVEPSYSSGSSSYDPTYSVSTPSKTEHGTVTVSPKSASKGDRVTVTVKPDSGYVLETLTVTDKNGNELTLKDKGNGKYTFTMPAGKVEVKATFMEDNSMLNFFYDVPNNAYFYEAVKWAVKNGITTGVGNDLFAPEQPCARAQIVTFLWRAAGSPEPKGAASGMTDVVSGSYYEKAVAWAIENGITTGTTTSTFSPDATCTRAQAVTFLARALNAKAASAAEFSDVPTDSYFADAVAWAAANGVTEGIGGGLFGSDNDCTRGQIVTFLYRAYNK